MVLELVKEGALVIVLCEYGFTIMEYESSFTYGHLSRNKHHI